MDGVAGSFGLHFGAVWGTQECREFLDTASARFPFVYIRQISVLDSIEGETR